MIKICIQDFVYHKQEISLPVGEWRIPNVLCRVVISRFVGFFFPKLLLIGEGRVCRQSASSTATHVLQSHTRCLDTVTSDVAKTGCM